MNLLKLSLIVVAIFSSSANANSASDLNSEEIGFVRSSLSSVSYSNDGVCSYKSATVVKIINRADGISYALTYGNTFIDISNSNTIKVIENILNKYDIKEIPTGDGRENHQTFGISSSICRFEGERFYIN